MQAARRAWRHRSRLKISTVLKRNNACQLLRQLAKSSSCCSMRLRIWVRVQGAPGEAEHKLARGHAQVQVLLHAAPHQRQGAVCARHAPAPYLPTVQLLVLFTPQQLCVDAPA